jgi:hypothetical protein
MLVPMSLVAFARSWSGPLVGALLSWGSVTAIASESPPVVPSGPGVRAPAPAPSEVGDDPTLSGDIDVGIFAERRPDRDVASLSPHLRLGIRPRPTVEILGGFGAVATFMDGTMGRENSARPSNIDFGLRWVKRWGGDRYREASAGFHFAIPTGGARTDLEAEAYDYALGGRGGWNPWDWTPSTLGLVLPAEIHAQVWRRLVVGGEVGIGGLFPAVQNTSTPEAAAQVAGQARYVLPWLALGLRVQGVYNGARRAETNQVAIAPMVDVSLCRRGGPRLRGTFARTTAECPVYASARLNLNLDAPYGFVSRDAMRLWGLQVGLGWAVF